MKHLLKAAFILGFIISIAATAPNSMRADFNGSWQIDTSKSDFGELPIERAAAIKFILIQSKTDVAFDRTFHNLPVGSKETLKLDGTEFENKQSDHTVKRTLQLSEDKLTLTVNSKYHMTPEEQEPWDYTRAETYALAKDGKSILLTRISVTPGGTETVKAFYNRVFN